MISYDDIILVSAARSGSTWVCEQMNRTAGVVALDEPYLREDVAGCDPDQFISLVDRTFREQRQRILTKGRASTTKAIAQDRLGNHYGAVDGASGLRVRQVELGEISVQRNLPKDFTLVAKHTIPFAGTIDLLIERYPTYVLIRNPIEILSSWNSIDAAYQQGAIQPYASALTGDLEERLETDDRLERQLRLLEWHFERFALADPNHVIRYENLVSAGLAPLKAILGGQPETVGSKLPLELISNIECLAKLIDSRPDESPIFAFYSRADLQKTLERSLR